MKREQYQALLNQAMISVVRSAMKQSLQDGNMNFFITFNTQSPNVQITEDLESKYPNQMSIILQNKFESFKIFDEYFSVVLTFSGVKKFLSITFKSITYFLDRESNFALELHNIETESTDDKNDCPTQSPTQSSKIISLDKYKK